MLTSSRRGPGLSVTILLVILQAAWSSAQSAPQIAINGSESGSVTFEEEKGQLPLFSGGNMVSITDSDSTHLSETILMLEAGGDAALESLRLNMTALPEGVVPQSNYQSEQGLLSITGDYSLAEYESILSAVEYVSTNRNPDDTVQMRPIVICRVRDTSNFWSNNLTVTIAIVAFNDPPAVYLGGPTQLNNAVTYGTASSSLQIATRTQIHIDDPDTQSTIEVQIVLELETVNGDPIDLAEESLFSPSPALQQVNSTVYVTQTLSNDLFPATISQVAYRNNNPSATIGGTRVVRVTAMDVELVTNGGSSFRGMTSQPSFTFILVGEEPLAPTTPPDASTTTELLQTPPITTSAPTTTADASTTTELLQTPPITTSAPTTTADFSSTSTTDQITTTETNVQDITTTVAPVSTDTTGDVVEITTAVDHTIDTTVTTVLACPEELNIPLIPGSTLGLLVYNWTQTSVDNDHIGQPCPMVCQELAGLGTRMGEVQRRCVKDERAEAEWSPVDVSECGLSDTALQLCENSLNVMASTEAALMLTDAVLNITSQPERLDTSAIAVTTTLIENLTQTAIQQPEIRENYLQVIDNIMSADQNTILEGQVQFNSSARLLESLRDFSENAPIGATTMNGSNNASRDLENFIVYAFDNFGLILEDVDAENFTGEAFSVDLGPVKEAVQENGRISEESLIRMATALPNATAAVVVPDSLFDSDTHYQNISLHYNSSGSESVSFTNNTSVHAHRLIFSVFLQNSIFQNEMTDCSKKAIGSIIASFQVNSSMNKLDNASIKATFQENRQACEDKDIPEESAPICSIFQVESNAIRYSSENCRLISSEGGVAKCECSQPGHFGLLFDLKPGEPFLPELLRVTSYIGACLSILCLLLVLIIYLGSRDLRSAKQSHQGQLVINTSFALLGLYIVFIVSGHVTSVRPLCGLMAALLQFFLLTYFSWTSVEALLLLFKIVLPLHKFGEYFVLKASLFAWLIPLVIVAVSVGAGHDYYISDFYCRSYDKPFYYGTVLPALLLYAFNWIVFIVILLSFIHKHVQMSGKGADSAHTSSKKKLKTYFTLIVALSFFFGLGWGFGLAATSSDIPELTFTFQLLFCIFVGSQGILVFILHCVRPQRMRKKWKSWCNKLTKCTGLSRLTKLHPKSPVGSSKNNGFSAHYNNYHKRVKHHDNVAITTPPLATAMENHSNVIKNMDATVYSNGQSSSGLYELTQSAPYCIQTSDSSSKGFDNPSYMSISPPNSSLRTQTLPQVSSVTLTHTNRGNKRNVCTLESFPNTEIIDLDD